MKHIPFFMGLLFVAACSSDDDSTGGPQSKTVTFTAQVETNSTRAHLEDGGVTVVWDEGDKILFNGSNSQKQECAITIGTISTSAKFTAQVNNDETSFVALHPCRPESSRNGLGFQNIYLPSQQAATSGSCDPQTALMMAQSSNTYMQFKNLCACVKVTVPDTLAQKGVTKIVLETPGKQLAGYFNATISSDAVSYTYTADTITFVSLIPASGTISEGTYYMSILPTTLSAGTAVATLTFVTNAGIYKTKYDIPSGKSLTFARNKNKELPVATKQQKIDTQAHWVDLGEREGDDNKTKVLWYSQNVGATSLTDGGDFYAWADATKQYSAIGRTDQTLQASGIHYYDVTPSDAFTQSKAPYYTTGGWTTDPTGNKIYYDSTYGGNNGLKNLKTDDDVAYRQTSLVGYTTQVQMPTKEHFTWLYTNCTWQRTDNYLGSGMKGFIVTSNVEGYKDKFIFLPCEGFCEDGKHKYFQRGINTSYWSNTVGYNMNYAHCLYLNWSQSWDKSAVGDPSASTNNRHVGGLVRPVKLE